MIKQRIKKNILWRYLAPCVFALGDLIWTLTYGAKSYLLYLLKSGAPAQRDLRKSGLQVFHGDPFFEEFAKWLHSQIPVELLERETAKLEDSTALNGFVSDIIGQLDMETKLAILKFALSKRNIDLVCGYFGFVPRLASAKLLLNIPKAEMPVGSQRWHRDWYVHKGLNIFTCLTDVDEDSGIYSAIGENWISRYAEIPVLNLDESAEPWDRDRVSDEQMLKFVPADAIERLTGPPGTTVAVASGIVYHKGGHCRKRHRLMLELSYQSEEKPGVARNENILSVLGVEGHEKLREIIDTPVRHHLVEGFQAGKGSASIFHWISRKCTYYPRRLAGADNTVTRFS